jgi:hypothetical protein
METEIDIEIKKTEQRLKEVPNVVNRYMRMRFKRNFKKLFGLNLK